MNSIHLLDKLTIPNEQIDFSQDIFNDLKLTLLTSINSLEDFKNNIETTVQGLKKLNSMSLNNLARYEIVKNIFPYYAISIEESITDHEFSTLITMELSKVISNASKILLKSNTAFLNNKQSELTFLALFSLLEEHYTHCRNYYYPLKALWKEINALYQYAFDNNFLSNDNFKIDFIYKKALIFQSAQPEHLTLTEMAILREYIEKWAHTATIHRQETREFNARYFYVDLSSDTATQSIKSIEGAANDPSIRVLNIIPIIDRARSHLKEIKHNTNPLKTLKLSTHNDIAEVYMCLKKSLKIWKLDSQRVHERFSCSVKSKFLMGLENICGFLNSQKMEYAYIEMQTINSSQNGACISTTNVNPTQKPAIGDVLLHQDHTHKSGRLGCIRWLKCIGKEIIFGIEYVQGNLKPVIAQMQGCTYPSLLLTEKSQHSLITHRSHTNQQPIIKLMNHDTTMLMPVQPKALINRNEHIDQIRVQIREKRNSP